MALVSAGHLERWGKTTIARNKLGELLGRLVHVCISLQDIRQIRFPTDESTQLSGWDGLLDCVSTIHWIPSGTSIWELSTESNARNKIARDYKKRLNQELPSDWHKDTNRQA